MSLMSQKDIQEKLRVLGKKHTWRILTHVQKGAKYITQISDETDIPYTTVQHRVRDLERAGLVRIVNQVDQETGRAIKLVRVSNFRINLTPVDIARMVEKTNEPVA
jgi:DNA-binding HxlR family transcriptional regulator